MKKKKTTYAIIALIAAGFVIILIFVLWLRAVSEPIDRSNYNISDEEVIETLDYVIGDTTAIADTVAIDTID